VYKRDVTEAFKNTYRASLEDVIELDVAIVAASGNINVSRCFLGPMLDTSYDRND
jgi:hypothetical protein